MGSDPTNSSATPEPERTGVPDPYDDFDLRRIVVFLWKGRTPMLAATLIALLAGVVYTLAREPTYAARATVVVRLPVGPTPLGSPDRVKAAVETFAMSPFVRGRLQARLDGKQLEFSDLSIEASKPLGLEQPSVPELRLVARSRNASEAAAISNAWATTLVDGQSRLNRLAAPAVPDAISTEYRAAIRTLAEAQRKQYELVAEQQVALADLQFRKGVDRMTARVAAIQAQITALEEQRDSLAVNLVGARSQVRTYEDELKRIPQYIGTAAADSDAAVTGRPAGAEPVDGQEGHRAVNPLYVHVRSELIDAQAQVVSLAPQRAEVVKQLGALQTEVERTGRQLLEANNAVQRLQNQQATQLVSAEHTVSEAKAFAQQLRLQFIGARLVATQGAVELSIGSRAAVPTAPEPRHALLIVAAWIVGGMFVGLLAAWVGVRLTGTSGA